MNTISFDTSPREASIFALYGGKLRIRLRVGHTKERARTGHILDSEGHWLGEANDFTGMWEVTLDSYQTYIPLKSVEVVR